MTITELVETAHSRSVHAGWWDGICTVDTVPAKLCLIHSEVSEAMEGFRKNLFDDKLPHRKMAEVELADAIIRIADLAGYLNYDLEEAILEKMEYNEHREDHKPDARSSKNGKRF
jgi:NTP pyrophosphatase (non-canonical NTP hydrolase)